MRSHRRLFRHDGDTFLSTLPARKLQRFCETSCLTPSASSMVSGLEDDLLYLHLVKQLISLSSLRERHDLVEHEAATISRNSHQGFQQGHLPEFVLVLCQHRQRLWENGPDGAAAHLDPQVLAVAGQRVALPSVRRRHQLTHTPHFLSKGSANHVSVRHHSLRLHLTPTSALCTPMLLMTPNGRSRSNAVLSAGLSPTTSITASAPLPSVTALTLSNIASFPS